jgi:hypothetical protein
MGKTQAPPQTLSKPKRSWERQHKTQNTKHIKAKHKKAGAE